MGFNSAFEGLKVRPRRRNKNIKIMVFRDLVLCTVHRPQDDPRWGVGVSDAVLGTAGFSKGKLAAIGKSDRLIKFDLFV
jgi:hypothetical protein